MFWPTPQTMDMLPPRGPGVEEWNNQRDGRRNRRALSNLREAVHSPVYLAGLEDVMGKDRQTSFVDGSDLTLWPTPDATGRPHEGNVRLLRAKVQAGEITEEEAAAILGKSVWEAQGKLPALWPTPNASHAGNDINLTCSGDGRTTPNKLGWAVAETMWRTPSSQEPGLDASRLVDKDGNPPTHFNQRLYDKYTGRLAQHSLSQDVLIAGFSPPATPASRSATPGSGPERMTPGTSGLRFVDCLPDFRATDRIGWFSKMFVATSAWGSTVCSLTWTTSATPAGRGLYLLRASARSTAGTGCGSSDAGPMPFQTPTVEDATRQGSQEWADRWANGETPPTTHQRLRTQALAAERMWPTPIVGDAHLTSTPEAAQRRLDEGKETLSRVVAARMWPTPRHEGHDAGRHRGNADSLHSAVKEATGTGMWGTPTSRDLKATGDPDHAGIKRNRKRGLLGEQAIAAQPAPGQKLNPDFVERLMGYPEGWTVLSPASDAAGSTESPSP